jgi:hypothetical protein
METGLADDRPARIRAGNIVFMVAFALLKLLKER